MIDILLGLLEFIAKRIISPITLSSILAIIGFYYLKAKRITIAKYLFAFAVSWIAIWSQPYMSDLLLYPLEYGYERSLSANNQPDYIFVPACYYNTKGNQSEISRWHECSMQRLIEAIRLHRQSQAPILLTGGRFLSSKEVSYSIKAKELLLSLGVSSNMIITIDEGTNTTTEIDAAYPLLHGNFIWIVSSATHIRRLHAEFKQRNIAHKTYPVDYHSSGILTPYLKLPSARALTASMRGFYEYLALIKHIIVNET